MKYRIPRKQKKQIPKGMYCYKATSGWKRFKDGTYGFEVKTCPFYTDVKYKDMKPQPMWMDEEFLEEFGENKHGWCKLVKTDIEDQCKSCGLKRGF